MEEGNVVEKKEVATRGKCWTSNPLDELEINITKEGPGSLAPVTVMHQFKAIVEAYPNKVALSVKRDGKWVEWTWKKYYDEAMMCARAILHFNVTTSEAINIIGFNSPEWFIADLAAIAAGAIVAPIYSTNGPDAVHYIAEHSSGAVAFVENEQQCKKFLQIRDRLPSLRAIVQWSGTVAEEKDVYSWGAFLKLGEGVDSSVLQKRTDELKPARCATLIYTSGTTGPPKAVMVSHDNITWTARAVAQELKLQHDDVIISYLPLSHIAAQMVDVHTAIATGYSIFFAQPDALKGSLLATLKECRPTLFLGVPRVWEKIAERMQELGSSVKGLKKTISSWAKAKGLQTGIAEQNHQGKPWGFWLANVLVFHKVREALGLDRARLCASAAAPIARETLDYFLSLNIPIYEIYGMSECTGPQTFNLPHDFRIGSTGKSLPGTELKLDKPNEEGHGEICYKGRHIFMGYMKDPKSTSETFDEEGFLHSGDVGALSKEGFLSITGRIKELIITAGGENIPPVLIEDELKSVLGHFISNVIVIGDRRKFLSCAFTLRTNPIPDPKQNEYPFTNELTHAVVAAIGDESVKTVEDAMKSEKVKKFLQDGINKANQRAASNAQKIQKFILLPRDFTIEGGELTPTLKLKRRIVVQAYQNEIEEIYKVDE